jgi:hypothetical protein
MKLSNGILIDFRYNFEKRDFSMQKISIMVVLMGLSMMMSGCTKTWNGIKHDSNEAWKTSKKAIHDATE